MYSVLLFRIAPINSKNNNKSDQEQEEEMTKSVLWKQVKQLTQQFLVFGLPTTQLIPPPLFIFYNESFDFPVPDAYSRLGQIK